jgi:hypothetical protein
MICFMQADVASVVAHVRKNIDLSEVKLGPEFDYASLPLCIIDAVYSMGVNYSGTQNTVERWRKREGWPKARSEGEREHTVSEFLDTLKPYSNEQLAESVFRNRQRTSARSGILKSEAVRQFAGALRREGIERFADLRSPDAAAAVEPAIREIKGQSSGKSFKYFMMMAGHDDYVKADRMICRFVGDALGLNHEASAERAESLLREAAHVLGVTPRVLDYAVWNHQRSLPTPRRTRECA